MLHTNWWCLAVIREPRLSGCVDHTVDPKLKPTDFIWRTASGFRSGKVASFASVACYHVNSADPLIRWSADLLIRWAGRAAGGSRVGRLTATKRATRSRPVPTVPRLPRKPKVDVSKRHASHAKCRSAPGDQRRPSAPPDPAQCHKCHACHAKRRSMWVRDKVASERLKIICDWQSCVWKIVRDKDVCDKVVCVCDKDVCDKVVCDKVLCEACVWQSCVCVKDCVCVTRLCVQDYAYAPKTVLVKCRFLTFLIWGGGGGCNNVLGVCL